MWKNFPASLEGKVELTDLTSAIKRAQVIVLLVDHQAFSSLTLGSTRR
jgi:UDP-N-acetyl-D-mannosaminuronate dehydrogenase